MEPAIDYDLHGLAGIRILGATPRDVAAVDRQLGPIRGELSRAPDIVVRFVDHLEVGSPVRLLGVEDAGFTQDAFLILRSRHKSRARVRIPLERVGSTCEIVCERGLAAVPLLVAVVNLTVLARGALPLHASAFVHDGRGMVVCGWSKGGKTEAVLAFMARGARFVGDEWLYVTGDGTTVHGLPEPMRIWDWHLAQLPALRGRVARADRIRLAALRTAAGLTRGRRARRVGALVGAQLHVDAAPARLFGPGVVARSAPFDHVFLVGNWDQQPTVARPIAPAEVAARMAASLAYERTPLMNAYQQFRFAFPERRNPLLEAAASRERALLERVLDGKPSHAIDHPYPVDLDELFEAMRSVL
ncbi:MAG: hypothetical protein ABI950_06455 [Solirubrobacteraceae bacterium]